MYAYALTLILDTHLIQKGGCFKFDVSVSMCLVYRIVAPERMNRRMKVIESRMFLAMFDINRYIQMFSLLYNCCVKLFDNTTITTSVLCEKTVNILINYLPSILNYETHYLLLSVRNR